MVSLTVGWVDTNIHDFLLGLADIPAGMALALVTSLDSDDAPAQILVADARWSDLRGHATVVGKGFIVRTDWLRRREQRQQMFFGFDEVWFFPLGKGSAKPEDVFIVGPNRIETRTSDIVDQWMKKSGCRLGLGDGTGMNFCARLGGVAAPLVRVLGAA